MTGEGVRISGEEVNLRGIRKGNLSTRYRVLTAAYRLLEFLEARERGFHSTPAVVLGLRDHLRLLLHPRRQVVVAVLKLRLR